MEICPKDNVTLVTLGDDPLVGSTLQHRYKIESVIGRGAMGTVYKASQEIIGRQVAIKVLHTHLVDDNDALKRFHQQAKAASRLNHPNIITLYDYGVIAGGQPYIVMDLLKGVSLAAMLEQREYLPADETSAIVKQVCDALSDAHKHGVVHRDVKPDNIVLEETARQNQSVKVVDFGIAKIMQSDDETQVRITRTGMVCGSPAYMSPEQFKGGDVDARSDIYALSVLIFEMLTGRLPFQARDLVTLMSLHVSEMPPKLSKVRPDLTFPAELEKAIEHALAKNQADRPQTMEDFWQELEAGFNARLSTSGERALPSMEPALSGREIQELVSAKISAKNKQVEDDLQKWVRSTTGQSSDSAVAGSGKSSKVRATLPWWVKSVGTLQSLLPYLFTLSVICALYSYVLSDRTTATLVNDKLKEAQTFAAGFTGVKSGEPEQLFSAGKLEETREILEKRKTSGNLSKSDAELLSRTYIRLSDGEARKKNYKQAIALLEQVPGKGAQASRAKALIRRYRKLLAR